MKLVCPLCKAVFKRSVADVKRSMTKRGYKTYCTNKNKSCFAKPVGRDKR